MSLGSSLLALVQRPSCRPSPLAAPVALALAPSSSLSSQQPAPPPPPPPSPAVSESKDGCRTTTCHASEGTITNTISSDMARDLTTAPAAMAGRSETVGPGRSSITTVTSSTASSPPPASRSLQPTPRSEPVQIPARPKQRGGAAGHPQKPERYHHGHHHHHSHGHGHGHGDRHRAVESGSRRPRDVHSPDSIPPSVAALLALTSIPPPRRSRRKATADRPGKMTVESIIERSQESEKELSWTLSRSPMEVLLSAPEDLEEGEEEEEEEEDNDDDNDDEGEEESVRCRP
ncbi:hypothetical protein VTK73DRAFT_5021 [Phialemonium thermophilum]|uniref:Uncharacterized protein n=1 Tax=Phialemonium thermophilum TaxID=223376 RepID=A0ABR3V497_9PEZI